MTLAHGWRAPDGAERRRVALRPALVRDEWRALSDFRVALAADRLGAVLVARVGRWLDADGARLDAGVVEALSREDRRLLLETYRDMNGYAPRVPRANEARTP